MPSASDGVEVKLGADTSAATEGMSSAASSIKGHLDDIKSSLAGFKDKNDETTKAIVESNKKASDSFLGLSEAVRVRFGSINSAFEQFRTSAKSLGEAFLGFTVLRKSIEEVGAFEEDVRGLEIAFGMTAKEATNLSVALKLAGISSQQYGDMLMRVQMNMRTQSSEFDRLGVKIRDSNGAFLSADTILQNVYKRMQDFKSGTDQNLLVLTLLGRSARDFAGEMERYNAVQARATQLVAAYGLEMGPAKQREIENYKVEVNALKVAFEAIEDEIGEAIIGPLQQFSSYASDVGPAAAKTLAEAIKLIVSALDYLVSGFQAVVIETASWARTMTTSVQGAVRGVGAAILGLGGNYYAAAELMKTGNAQIKGDAEAAAEQIEDIWKGHAARMKRLWNEMANDAAAGGGAPIPKSGPKSFPLKPEKGAGGDDRLAQWKDELEQMQEAEGYFHEMSKAEEAGFWEAKLMLVQTYGKQDVKLRQELDKMIFADHKAAAHEQLADDLATIQREIDEAKNNKDQQLSLAKQREAEIAATYGTESKEYQKALEQETKLREEWAKKEEALVKDASKFKQEMAKLEVADEQQALNQAVALRQVSAQQKFEVEQQLENQLYALKLKELQDTLSTLKQGTLEYQKQAEQIEILETLHQQKLTQIQNAAEQERKANMLQATADTQNAFATLFDSIATGTKSVKNAFLDFAKSIEDSLAKIASNQIAKQLFGPGTSGNSFLESMFGKIFGGGQGSGTGASGGAGAASGGAGQGLLGGMFSSANGLLGNLFGNSNAATMAANLSETGSSTSSGGLLGGLFGTSNVGSLFGDMFSTPDSSSGAGSLGSLTGATQDAGTATTTAAMTALSTVVTTTTTSFTAMDTIMDTLQAGFANLQAAAAAAAMQSMAASGAAGGVGSLFGSVPAFASGTPYVPQDMLAIVHQGEAIIPASVNQGGGFGLVNHNHFLINGPTDARSQSQIAAAVARGLNVAQRRYM